MGDSGDMANVLGAYSEDAVVVKRDGASTRRSSSNYDSSPGDETTIGLPGNFAEVESGIYRSSFPRPAHFEELKRLRLKSILTLVEELPPENVKFIKENGIQHFHIPMPANKDPLITVSLEDMGRALSILLDRSNHPILVHCNKGKHRTGCVIGCLRKIEDWSLPSVITEYRKYSFPKCRALDERYVELFDEKALQGTAQAMGFLKKPAPTPPCSDRG